MEVAGRRKRRNLHLGLRLAVWLGFNLLVFGVSVLFTDSMPDSQQLQSDELSRYSRDVTSSQKTQNCTRKVSRNAINQYPKDLFTEEQRAKGAVILHVFFGLYLFLATAIVCEDYFMPAIYVCTERFQLDPGIVGAVIVGSFCSSPELATTTIGVFISENDVGVGAMVGTAVTNYVLIIGLCCLMKPAGKDVMVQPWTVTRDTVWGGIAMVVFIIVVMDGKADWDESIIMVIVYLLYVFSLFFNATLARCFRKLVPDPKPDDPPCCCLFDPCCRKKDEEKSDMTKSLVTSDAFLDAKDEGYEDEDSKDEEEEEEPESFLNPPKKWDRRAWWVVCLPIYLHLYLTVPDCRRERWRGWWAPALFMCMVWITTYCYLIIWMATITGHTFGMSDDLMGLTTLGIGTSLPDIVSAIVSTKDGEGDMAVSTAIGALVFCMMFCIGFPWFIRSATTQFQPVTVHTAGLSESSIATTVFVVIVFTMLCCSRFHLRRAIGVICGFLFLVFLIFAVYVDKFVLSKQVCVKT
ncbi:PREDICTED: sodium/potassium/calcium exchanger 3-like [Branchiostoma belcheri]|uniref:Sodium/potassium/calcium exchanger 3-like n=1 Tax=Branchiostoma belcheri TaxID=7741 RepID=A0A6P4YFX4_BRABE|nr:PREDICTED: sodium/potassium/calcium exchanger 3-like [Branchiostoma belcheri]